MPCPACAAPCNRQSISHDRDSSPLLIHVNPLWSLPVTLTIKVSFVFVFLSTRYISYLHYATLADGSSGGLLSKLSRPLRFWKRKKKTYLFLFMCDWQQTSTPFHTPRLGKNDECFSSSRRNNKFGFKKNNHFQKQEDYQGKKKCRGRGEGDEGVGSITIWEIICGWVNILN